VFTEKSDQNVFGNIFYKIWAILMKFGGKFPE